MPFGIGERLGEMKIEGTGSECRVWLPKTYKFTQPDKDRPGKNKTDYKAKGVPRRKAEEFVEQGKAEFDLPFRLREAIRFYDDENSRKLSVWRRVQKIMQSSYDRKRRKGNFYLPKIVDNVNFDEAN